MTTNRNHPNRSRAAAQRVATVGGYLSRWGDQHTAQERGTIEYSGVVRLTEGQARERLGLRADWSRHDGSTRPEDGAPVSAYYLPHPLSGRWEREGVVYVGTYMPSGQGASYAAPTARLAVVVDRDLTRKLPSPSAPSPTEVRAEIEDRVVRSRKIREQIMGVIALIEEHGWCRHHRRDSEGRLSIEGAVGQLLYGSPHGSLGYGDTTLPEYLVRHQPMGETRGLPGLNDSAFTSRDEVLAWLRGLAGELTWAERW